MKIAFVFPEVYDIARFYGKRKEFPPFGVLYLSAILEEEGFEVEIFSATPNQTHLRLEKFEIVAFSIPSSVTYHIIKSVRENSSFSSRPLLIAGGVHATIYPEKTLTDLNVDVVGIGPGEETILEIVNEYKSKNFSKIKGACYKNGDNVFYTDLRKLKNNLDHLPVIPARHLLPIEDNIMTNRLSNTSLKMTHVMLTQGCPYSCNFCASQQRKIQYRSGWHIEKELVHLIKTYSIEGFAVVGDNFLVNRERTKNICNTISGLGLKWSTLSRVDTVEHDALETMQDAGCIEIKFGVESGSEKMLSAMGKNISINQICNAIKITNSIGIKVKIFLIHGYPGENMETTNETIKLLKKMLPMIERVSLFRFAPLPGSFVYKNYEQNGLLISNSDKDWHKSHIHHNHYRWWGTKKDFEILTKSYKKLDNFVSENWA
jgi:anaerobic magnesium-protoporphyrin IX monomethyl ester cyclase